MYGAVCECVLQCGVRVAAKFQVGGDVRVCVTVCCRGLVSVL